MRDYCKRLSINPIHVADRSAWNRLVDDVRDEWGCDLLSDEELGLGSMEFPMDIYIMGRDGVVAMWSK